MKAIIEGQEHIILGEPTPRVIHGLYVPELAPPIIIEDYEGQLADMYQANGLWCMSKIPALETYTVGELVQAESQEWEMDFLSAGVRLGPVLYERSMHEQILRARHRVLGFWMMK